jgi:hypothetical protein
LACLFPHLFPADASPLNHARYLFRDPRSQEFYPDWETSAWQSVSALRLLAGQDPADRALMTLVGELSTHSDEFRAWWGGHTVRTHTSGTKRINHPLVGEMTIGYDVLAVQSTPGLAITSYLPKPGMPSADALDMLGSWWPTRAEPPANPLLRSARSRTRAARRPTDREIVDVRTRVS